MPAKSDEERLYLQIEKKFKFALPPEYRLMREQGWMTLKRPIDSETFSVPGNNYLWIYDIEWYSLPEIADFKFPDYCRPHLANLVPFAFTGAGDWWCWQTDHATNERGPRVILCTHDSEAGTIYAPSLAATLFRQALGMASSYASDSYLDREPKLTAEGKAKIEEVRRFLTRWTIDLPLIFPADWIKLLADLSKRKPVKWHWTAGNGRAFHQISLLSAEERAQIEKEKLAFPEMDEDIVWMNVPRKKRAKA